MANSKALAIGFKTAVVDTVEIAYTAPTGGQGVHIDASTVSNNTTASVSYKAYIYDSAGTTIGVYQPQTIVVRDRFSPIPGLVNHVVPAGGTIRVETSTANSLEFSFSGIEQ